MDPLKRAADLLDLEDAQSGFHDYARVRGILYAMAGTLIAWGMIFMLLLWSYQCRAGDEWDPASKYLAGSALAATLADWSQTRYIAKHPDQFYETNRVLGKHPTTGKVDAYFAGSIALSYFIADQLPSNYRKIFLGGITVVEISFVNHNKSLGIGWSF